MSSLSVTTTVMLSACARLLPFAGHSRGLIVLTLKVVLTTGTFAGSTVFGTKLILLCGLRGWINPGPGSALLIQMRSLQMESP